MSRALEQAANFAVWQMQFSTDRAVRYITRKVGVTEQDARAAVQQVALWYRG